MEKLTRENTRLIFNRLKSEIIEDISSRNDMITFSFNDEDITLQKIY